MAEKGKAPLTNQLRPKRVSKPKSMNSTQIIDRPGSSASTAGNSTVADLTQLADRPGPSGSTTGSSKVTNNFSLDDDYECSECLGTYSEDMVIGNGAEWIECGCGQWIHEDCVVNTMIGSDGTERMCSNCIL